MQQNANPYSIHENLLVKKRSSAGDRCRFVALGLSVVLLLACGRFAVAQTQGGAQPMQPVQGTYADNNAYIDTLTRGPIHEAFAEPIEFNPEPGPLAPTAPPEPIPEIPPDYRPAGANVTWIPGYWTWDDESNDYLWVSGIWRDIPPGREWIAGYWIQSQNGYRWIPGFWADASRSQTLYLPEPPVSVESGPNYQAAPSDNDIWISGTWLWDNGRYAWRPGHWVPGRPDWIWVPAHYVWSPRGYVFVDGYWDYDLDRRGILFAPVRFRQNVYRRPQFRYSPDIVIDLRTLTNHLFLRTNHYHYYFGDYFDEHDAKRGFRAWFTVGTSRKIYDPIFVHQRWRHRNDRDWEHRLRSDFDYRRRNAAARPPRSWARQRVVHRRDKERNASPVNRLRHIVGKALSTVVRRKHDSFDFRPIDEHQRRDLSRRREGIQHIRSQRREVESRRDGRPDERYRRRTKPAHGPGYRSPFRSKPVKELDKGHRPPKRVVSPKTNGSVKPERRAAPRKGKVIRKDDNKKTRDRGHDKGRKDRDDRKHKRDH